MDGGTWLSVALVLVFILIGGVFAGTEIALVTLRRSQVDALERRGKRGARVAAVARDPNRFLAAVQIGVTTAGFLGAAYGASTLAPDFAPTLERIGVGPAAAQALALVMLTLVIVYASLLLGELVPKRLALQRASTIALVVAPPLDRFATVMRPVIWLLSHSTNAVMRLVGGNPHLGGEEMTDEELRELVAGYQGFTSDERAILQDVLTSVDRTVAEVMRPRGEVVFVGATLSAAVAASLVQHHPYSRYPITGEGFDDVLGFLHVRDLLGAPPDVTVGQLGRSIIRLPGTGQLLPSLSYLRREGAHIAVVVDEYGGTDGIVTLEDMIEELIGEIQDEYDHEEPAVRPMAGGRFSVEGLLTIEDFAERTGLVLPDGPYETVAGYLIDRLGRLAEVGDTVAVDDHALVVTEVTRRRIVRIDVIPGG